MRERMSRGWGSVSLMQPMPHVPWNVARSSSNLVRNGVFSMEWISRWKPVLLVAQHHAGALGAQMRVVVDSEEHVQNDIAMRRCAEECAHFNPLR